MILKKLIFGHYCSYKETIEVGEFTRINFLIGKNGSGKSSLLKCFNIFYDIFHADFTIDVKDIYDSDSTKNLTLGFEIDITGAESTELLQQFSNCENFAGIKTIHYELQYKQSQIKTEFFKIYDVHDKIFTLYESNHDKDNVSTIDLHTFFQGYSSNIQNQPLLGMNSIFQFLHVWRSMLNKLQTFFDVQIIRNTRSISSSSTLEQNESVPINGENFASWLNTASSNYTDTEQKYAQNISELSDKTIERVKSPNSGRTAKLQINMSGLKSSLEFDQISSGEKQQVHFAIIPEIKTTDILCIEEPELHLHASAQQSLLDVLKKYSKDTATQLFIESHSPIFVGCESDESTCLFLKNDSATTVNMITKSNINNIKRELGINYAHVFDNDYFLFVEGDSERRAFRILKNIMNYDKSVDCWTIGGKNKVHQLEFFLKYLYKSGRKILIIVDNHDECVTAKEKLKNKNSIKDDEFIILNKSFEDTFDKQVILNVVKDLYGNEASTLIEKKYDSNEHINKLLESKIDGTKHQKKYKKKEFAAALANTITQENINSNDFGRAVNDFLS